MDNDDPTGPERSSLPGPPPAPGPDPLPPPPGPEPEPVSAASSRRRWPWVAGLLTVVALAAIGTALVLLVQATGDKNDAEDALVETRAELDDTSDRLGASDELADELRSQLEEQEEELADTNAELDEAVEERDENMDVLIDFLGMSFTLGPAGIDQDQGECMAESLIEARGPGIVMVFMDVGLEVPEEFTFEMADLGFEVLRSAEECDVPPEFFSGGVEFGVRYGDNPTLDALHDQCRDGVGTACDTLYFTSQVGSEYETFAASCGDRFDLASAPALCEGSI